MAEYLNKFLNSLYDFREMFTMEETFILTGVSIIIVGVALGFLFDWLLRKGKQEKTKEDN